MYCNRTASSLAMILALVVLLAGCQEAPQEDSTREVPRNVRTMVLETSPVVRYLELAGPVVPLRGADLSSEESGTLDRVVHDKGDRVEAGAAVLTLDRRLLAAELQAAEAQFELQAYNHERVEQLHQAGKVSELERLQSAAQLAAARGQRDVARTRHDRASIKAPFAGIVADRHVEPGELVVPGAPVARVVDPYVLKLEGSVTEQEIGWLRPGQPAEVTLYGVAEPVAATVGWVGVEAAASTGKFPVEIHVPNPELTLSSGAIGRARVVRDTTTDMVVIPRDAVMATEGIEQVYVVEGDRARRRLVELGPSQGLMVAIRSGLAPGDQLVVRGHRDLRDGGLVSVTEQVPPGDGTQEGDPSEIRAASAGTRIAGEDAR